MEAITSSYGPEKRLIPLTEGILSCMILVNDKSTLKYHIKWFKK